MITLEELQDRFAQANADLHEAEDAIREAQRAYQCTPEYAAYENACHRLITAKRGIREARNAAYAGKGVK